MVCLKTWRDSSPPSSQLQALWKGPLPILRSPLPALQSLASPAGHITLQSDHGRSQLLQDLQSPRTIPPAPVSQWGPQTPLQKQNLLQIRNTITRPSYNCFSRISDTLPACQYTQPPAPEKGCSIPVKLNPY